MKRIQFFLSRYDEGVYIETYGCQMNEDDSERMLRHLEGAQYLETQEPREANLILINTCSVREKPEHKVYSALGRFKRLKENRKTNRSGWMCCSTGRRTPPGSGSLSRHVNIRDWKEVVWAITTRVDPSRDTVLVDNTPIDYLDFASPVSGRGSKMGIDATNKWSGETTREWGRPITMDAVVKARVDSIWKDLGL